MPLQSQNQILSRERAAGYDPDSLARSKMAVVGCGALGQNVALNLGLAQVGELWLVDFDRFERHNATRSPLFPSSEERQRLGDEKAVIVAHKLRKVVEWSERPKCRFHIGPVQAVGDALFRNASVVISAVDHDAARAYISDMSSRHGVPLVEGGFHGADVNCSILRNEMADDPCWRCAAPSDIEELIGFSCNTYATEVEQQGYIPATQTAAATLGAIMAEAAIQMVHEGSQLLNKRLHFNLRTGRCQQFTLATNQDCAASHERLGEDTLPLNTTSQAFARELLGEIGQRLNDEPVIRLPARFVLHAPCAGKDCANVVGVEQPVWQLRKPPRCESCGGGRRAIPRKTVPLAVFATLSRETPEIQKYTCFALGIAPGVLLEITDRTGETTWARVPGCVSDVFQSVSF